MLTGIIPYPGRGCSAAAAGEGALLGRLPGGAGGLSALCMCGISCMADTPMRSILINLDKVMRILGVWGAGAGKLQL